VLYSLLCYNKPLMNNFARIYSLAIAVLLVFAFVLPLAKVAALPVNKQDIVDDLIRLKARNSRLQNELSQLDSRLTNVDANLGILNDKIIDTEFNLSREIKILSQRAKAVYKDNRHHSSIKLILESKSFYELITNLDFFGFILKQDQKLVKQSKINRSKLINLKRNFLNKRQKIVTLKRAKERTGKQFRVVTIGLRKRLKIATKKERQQANKGLDAARFYNSYLALKQSPMRGLGVTFVTAGRQYKVNPEIVIAIAGVESGFGKHCANSFNAWGRKSKGGGYQGFSSWKESIINQTSYLRERYYNSGLTSLQGIGNKYAPGNGSWPGKVSHFLGDIRAYRRKGI